MFVYGEDATANPVGHAYEHVDASAIPDGHDHHNRHVHRDASRHVDVYPNGHANHESPSPFADSQVRVYHWVSRAFYS